MPNQARILEVVQQVIAKTTRYPLDVLTPESHLEDELGIDSVKQAEIMAVLAKELQLGQGLSLQLQRNKLATIGGIASEILRLHGTATKAANVDAPVENFPTTAKPVAKSGQSIVHPVVVAPVPKVSVPKAKLAPVPTVAAKEAITPKGTFAQPGLSERTVVVTGAGRGLGRQIALALGGLGARVVVNSFHSREAGEQTANDVRAAGGQAIHVWGSVAQPDHVERIFDEIGSYYGRVDALVANASDGFIGPFDELTPEHWERGFRTNVLGLHQCAVRAAALMPKGGQIIALSTVASARYVRDFVCQGTLKAAVEALVKYLAVELAPRGIAVNCVSAGAVYGELIEKFPNAAARISEWEALTPTGRLTEAQEVARVIAALAAGSFPQMTGATLVIDGGFALGIGEQGLR